MSSETPGPQALDDLRRRINEIDDQLVALAAERKNLSREVARVKRVTGRATRDYGREREVIFEEARIERDNPRTAIVRQLYALVFAGHPYGRPVLGTRETMDTATQERLRAFNRRWYVPDNMTLVVAGPVDVAGVRAAAERTFGREAATGYKRPPLVARCDQMLTC